jgi:predicted chitinase
MKPLVTVQELHKLMPHLNDGRAQRYAPLLCAAMEEFDITSKRRRCAFLAQLAHESVELRYMEEIASGAAYEGRSDLGNTHPGDGRKYKGRGPIQLTGRANYRRFGRILELDLEGKPELAAIAEHGFRIAALFWKLGGLNELADRLSMNGDVAERKIFSQITKRINGGYNGLSERLNYFRVAKQVLHNDDEDPNVSPIAPPTARPAESVHAQEQISIEEADAYFKKSAANNQAESPAEVSTDPDVGLLGAAVSSNKAKGAALKVWPRLVKHSSAGLTFVWAIVEANKVASILVLLVIVAGVLWLVYHNRKKLTPHILKLLK